MKSPALDTYQIKVVCQQSVPEKPPWKDVLITVMVTTRTSVADMAARLQKVYPKPEHLVIVQLLASSGQTLQVAWESLDEPGNGPE